MSLIYMNATNLMVANHVFSKGFYSALKEYKDYKINPVINNNNVDRNRLVTITPTELNKLCKLIKRACKNNLKYQELYFNGYIMIGDNPNCVMAADLSDMMPNWERPKVKLVEVSKHTTATYDASYDRSYFGEYPTLKPNQRIKFGPIHIDGKSYGCTDMQYIVEYESEKDAQIDDINQFV